jgi:Protein of unknown function (DUF2009)
MDTSLVGEAMSETTGIEACNVGSGSTCSIKQQSMGQHVECATYPLPQGLTQHIEAAVQHNSTTLASVDAETTLKQQQRYDVTLDSVQDALGEIVGNSIVALDTLYFSQLPEARKHDTFQHRLCIRVCADPTEQTLSITDLGIGMTRSDLINCLGIGSASSVPLLAVTDIADKYSAIPTRNDDVDDDDSTDVTSNDDEEDDDDGEDDEDETDADRDKKINSAEGDDDGSCETVSTAADDHDAEMMDEGDRGVVVGVTIESITDSYRPSKSTKESTRSTRDRLDVCCTSSSIGGFYAAFCTLATAVTVRTKSKFDEYYEFRIAPVKVIEQLHNNPNDCIATKLSYSTFEIRRPYPEGTVLNVTTGQNRFDDVRGESGTSVCFKLNQKAIDAGLLQEQEILKSIFLRIVESTEYTVAFSTDIAQAKEIIFASAVEDAYLAEKAAATSNDAEASVQIADVIMSSNSAIASSDGTSSGSAINRVKSQPSISSFTSSNSEDTSKQVNSYTQLKHDNIADTVLERSKFIPVRLSMEERKMLRLVEAAMNCCDYTTQVDQDFSKTKKGRRVHEQLRGITSLMNGLVVSCDYEAGQKLLVENNYSDFAPFIRQLFEIARRHKIMNPEKMRTEYGKLIYILQDAVSPITQQQLGFSVKQPILSVYRFLEERGGLGILCDTHIETATQEVLAGPGRTRSKIDEDIRQKERAVEHLKRKYRSSKLSSDDIHLCLYSICDNNSFLNSNRVPVDKMIDFLKRYFTPNSISEGYSLSIISGTDGSRLSHSHERQYYFALQSLTLWRTIMNDMFRLWAMAEEDLLSNDIVCYSLQDTGQGMQRVQQSPRTYKAMQQILLKVQTQVSTWVGSSVIHLGDHNVPNALSFIDKYTQGK